MDVKTGDGHTVSLLPAKMTLTESKDMTLFSIIECELINATRPKTGIQMRIKMKRKIMSEMMTTYFPSLLLMMITYATTFFKPFFFEAALSVNLTTMLVMTTIFISKMEGLPPTSATKMIDYWLILCQLVPFAQVVLLTAMEYLREEELEKEEDKKEQTPGTKEAGNKRSKVAYLPMLVFIGKLHGSLYLLVTFNPQRRVFCHWRSLLPSSSTFGLLPDSILNSFL